MAVNDRVLPNTDAWRPAVVATAVHRNGVSPPEAVRFTDVSTSLTPSGMTMLSTVTAATTVILNVASTAVCEGSVKSVAWTVNVDVPVPFGMPPLSTPVRESRVNSLPAFVAGSVPPEKVML